jgi:hypothetical protein
VGIDLHPELRGDEAVLVDIDLGENDAASSAYSARPFPAPGQRLARAAPFGPEIEHDERLSSTDRPHAAERLDRFLLVACSAPCSPLSLLLYPASAGHQSPNLQRLMCGNGEGAIGERA